MIKFFKKRVKRIPEPAEKLPPKTQLEKIADRIEKMRLANYLDMANRPSRIIWTNFLAGAARGIGFTIGAALIITIVVKVLMYIISMNIPYLSEQLVDIVEFIKSVPARK